MSSTLILDIRVNGYKGLATRLIATLDVATGLVYISQEKPFSPPERKYSIKEMLNIKSRERRTLVITDSADSTEKWDLLYTEANHLNEVVRAYHDKHKNNLLEIDPKVMGKFNPESVLQPRKLDVKSGAVWELSTETENGHICILLACWGALRAANNFSFAYQMNETYEHAYLEKDSDDMDEPFTI